MRFLSTALLTLVLAGGFAIAEDKPVEPIKDKPEQALPATPEERKAAIDKLVGQLGDDNPKVRQQATETLRRFGKDAQPALAEARKSEDLEVSTRATAISKQIEDDLAPKPPATNNQTGRGRVMRLGNGGGNVRIQIQGGGGIAIAGGGAGGVMSITRQETDGVKDTTATEGDRTTTIHEDADGIKMTVTEKKDGKDVSKEYKAKNAEALKKEHPEAHKLYEQYGGNGGGVLRIEQLNLDVAPGLIEIPDIQIQQDQAMKQIEQARQQMEEMRRQMLERHNNLRDPALQKRGDRLPMNAEPDLKKRLEDLNKELNLERQKNDELRQQMLKEIDAAKKEMEAARAKAEAEAKAVEEAKKAEKK